MNQQNQSDVDSLLEGKGSETLAAAERDQLASEGSSPSENTKESAPIQEEVPNPVKESKVRDPRGIPWVDFVPEFTHRHKPDLAGRLAEEMANKDEMLYDKELLKLEFLNKGIHRSYYWDWVFQSNRLFQALVRLKYRHLTVKAGKPQKEA